MTICLKFSVILFTSSSSASGSTMKTTSYCLANSKFILLMDVQPHLKMKQEGLSVMGTEPLQHSLPGGLSFTVVKRHSFQDAVFHDSAQRFSASVEYLFHFASAGFRNRIEHEPLCIRYRMIGLNSDPQPDEF